MELKIGGDIFEEIYFIIKNNCFMANFNVSWRLILSIFSILYIAISNLDAYSYL